MRNDFINLEKAIIENNMDSTLWPLMKYYIYNRNRESTIKSEKRNNNSFLLIMMFLYSVYKLGYYFIIGLCSKKSRKIIIGASSRLNEKKDWLFGSDADETSLKFYHFSSATLSDFKKLRSNRVVAINFIVQFFLVFLKPFSSYSMSKFIKKNTKIINLVISHESLKQLDSEQLRNYVYRYYLERKVYKLIFSFLNIKNTEALIVSAYSKCSVVAALNELRIKTIEYQHGLIAPFHPVYGYNKSIFSDLIVDEYRVNSEFWRDIFLRYESRPISIYVPDYFKVDEPPPNFEKPYIVFTSQDENYDEVIKFIEDYLRVINDVILVYRAHPRGDSYKVRGQFSSNPNFYYSGVRDRYTTRGLIKHSVLHISISSACHFDAFELKGCSYFLGRFNHLLFPIELVRDVLQDNAYLVKSVEGLKVRLDEII